MRCRYTADIKTLKVAPASETRVDLPARGVLRFERQGGALAGKPAMGFDGDTLALHFADGASLYLKTA